MCKVPHLLFWCINSEIIFFQHDNVGKLQEWTNKMYKYYINYDVWEDTYSPMRALGNRRSGHSCLLLNNELFVAGGILRITTEIFNLENNRWRSGPDMPRNIGYSQLVEAQPSSKYAAFLIGGGISSHNAWSDIYGLTKDLRSFKKIGDLKNARNSHVAMELSEELVQKCIN